MKRKHLITIGVIIAIVLLIYFSVLSCDVVRINNVSSQKIKNS